ncbi:MAG: hypothetical protein C4532_15670 [Candidatus Abyssobacteria bacterium SURF_17]|uniref:Transcription factor zinc-finger domain-containing protein n=1 Tax=Candidatus Abyssobacteria bacterium SURF_17 TaxID=2093361 RepID=A0A419ESZ8_9BACT|nr:MAG: hypothetical protein C4532_15670 [Candidatus Abyssubacteria bacterium SURF_17]
MNNKNRKAEKEKEASKMAAKSAGPTKPPTSYAGVGKRTLLDDKVQKPSKEEEKYFEQKELEQLKKFREEEKARKEAEEQERAQKIHHCKCPKCYGDLEEIVFKKKVRIDKCTQCGGVWLDNGELETLAGHGESFLSSFFEHLTGKGKHKKA